MTLPTPQRPPDPGPPPRRLALLTVPLLIALLSQCFSLLLTPFLGPYLETLLADSAARTGQPLPPLTPQVTTFALWAAFFLTAALILWLYNTRRAVLEGKSWGRVSAIVIGVLSLLLFPLGTLLGLVMLVGAFDRDVTNYTTR